MVPSASCSAWQLPGGYGSFQLAGQQVPGGSCPAGIRHPIAAAELLARESRQPLSNGRVRPM